MVNQHEKSIAEAPIGMIEACKYLKNCSQTTMRRLIAQNKITGRKMNSEWIFFKSEIEADIKALPTSNNK